MPEVGLEQDSKPCDCWEVARTCGIRASPPGVRGSPRWKVWTLSTLLFCPVATIPGAVAGHERSSESTVFRMGNNTAISIKSFHLLSHPSWRSGPEVHDRDQQSECHIGSPMRWVSQPRVHWTETRICPDGVQRRSALWPCSVRPSAPAVPSRTRLRSYEPADEPPFVGLSPSRAWRLNVYPYVNWSNSSPM